MAKILEYVSIELRTQDLISGINLLEGANAQLIIREGLLIWVKDFREVSVGFFDFFGRALGLDSQDLVGIHKKLFIGSQYNHLVYSALNKLVIVASFRRNSHDPLVLLKPIIMSLGLTAGWYRFAISALLISRSRPACAGPSSYRLARSSLGTRPPPSLAELADPHRRYHHPSCSHRPPYRP